MPSATLGLLVMSLDPKPIELLQLGLQESQVSGKGVLAQIQLCCSDTHLGTQQEVHPDSGQGRGGVV